MNYWTQTGSWEPKCSPRQPDLPLIGQKFWGPGDPMCGWHLKWGSLESLSTVLLALALTPGVSCRNELQYTNGAWNGVPSISPVGRSLAIVPESQFLSFLFCHNRSCQAVLTGPCNTLKVWTRHCFLWCSRKRSAPATPWAPQGNANETWPPPLFSVPVAFYFRRRGRASSIRLVICSFAVNASTEFAAAFPLFFWPLEKKKECWMPVSPSGCLRGSSERTCIEPVSLRLPVLPGASVFAREKPVAL